MTDETSPTSCGIFPNNEAHLSFDSAMVKTGDKPSGDWEWRASTSAKLRKERSAFYSSRD
jgi:hypothetical protein